MNRRRFLVKASLDAILLGSAPLILGSGKKAFGSDLESRTKIAFVSNRDGNYEIYIMNPDGSNQTRLTFNGKNDLNPSWSPDGKKIAFTSYPYHGIYVMNSDGSEQTRLTDGYDEEPAWSPDGSKITFHSARGGNWEICMMNADGSNQTYLVDGYSPTWSPDGHEIAFVHGPGYTCETNLYKIDLITNDITQITYYDDDPNTDVREPAWSPDGTKIAFTLAAWIDCLNGKIYLINPDGTGLEPLSSNLSIELNSTWSPDGKKIAFSYGWSDIYRINIDRTNQIRLTFGGKEPAWSPYLTETHIKNEAPSEFTLSQNYPNPFNSSTLIKYKLPKNTKVSLDIYNFLISLLYTLTTQN